MIFKRALVLVISKIKSNIKFNTSNKKYSLRTKKLYNSI